MVTKGHLTLNKQTTLNYSHYIEKSIPFHINAFSASKLFTDYKLVLKILWIVMYSYVFFNLNTNKNYKITITNEKIYRNYLGIQLI